MAAECTAVIRMASTSWRSKGTFVVALQRWFHLMCWCSRSGAAFCWQMKMLDNL